MISKTISSILLLLLAITKVTENTTCTERPYLDTTSRHHRELLCSQVPPAVFLKNLKALEVNGEIKEISNQLEGPDMLIEKLNLSKCGILEIKPNAFSDLQNLLILALSHNKIEFIIEDTFRNLHSLKKLFLEGNGIKVIMDGALKDLHSLEELNLSDNKLLEVPNNLPPLLQNLNLLNNVIERLATYRFDNLDKLEVLNVCGNDISYWSEGKYLSKVKDLCIGDRINTSGGYYLNSTVEILQVSAKHLNGTILSPSVKYTINSFSNLKNLRLENYKIDSFDFLHSLKLLRSLALDKIKYNNTKELPIFLFYLKRLHINRSPELANYVLNLQKPFHELTILDVKDNDIREILYPQSENILKTVQYLDISYNPLNCTAENWSWIVTKLNHNTKYLNNSDHVKCYEPPETKGETLFKVIYNDTFKNTWPVINITKQFQFIDENKVSKSDYLYGILFFVIFAICFVTTMTICTRFICIIFINKMNNLLPAEPTSYMSEARNSSSHQYTSVHGITDNESDQIDEYAQKKNTHQSLQDIHTTKV